MKDQRQVIEEIEKLKTEKYAPLSSPALLFFPLIFSAQGVYGDKVFAFVEACCKHLSPADGLRTELKRTILRGLAAALQAGNARMYLKTAECRALDWSF